MTQRTVFCKKLGRNAPGLDAPPFGGDLGKEIYDSVSQEAWAEWKDGMMIKIINEYRLNMAEPEQYNVLLEQMRAFLHVVPPANAPEGSKVLEVENETRGKNG